MWCTDGGGKHHSKNHPISTSSTKLRMHKNCIFVLPINIPMGVARWLLWPHDTLPCVLISKNAWCNLVEIWNVVRLLFFPPIFLSSNSFFLTHFLNILLTLLQSQKHVWLLFKRILSPMTAVLEYLNRYNDKQL